MKSTSRVYHSEACNRQSFTREILSIFKDQLGTAKRIFIKPNIVSSEPYPTTTHPEVLGTILGELSDHEIIVGDGPAIDAGRSDRIMRKTPLREICKNHGVDLVNLYSEPMKHMKSKRGYHIKFSTLPLSCDYIISLPVLKVHNWCGLSGALKNQFGYLSKLDRILMHTKMKSIQKGIAEVNVAVPTNLFIVDAIQIMAKAQECRHGGCPSDMGTMIAGTDPVSLDCYGITLLKQVEPRLQEEREEIRYIEYASDYGVGNIQYELRKLAL